MNVFAIASECQPDDVINPRAKSQTETVVQLVLSLALGVSAFIGFCVRPRSFCMNFLGPLLLTCVAADPATEMERIIRCAKAPNRGCERPARLARLLLWLDSGALSNN